jgi:hypothetical protein
MPRAEQPPVYRSDCQMRTLFSRFAVSELLIVVATGRVLFTTVRSGTSDSLLGLSGLIPRAKQERQ